MAERPRRAATSGRRARRTSGAALGALVGSLVAGAVTPVPARATEAPRANAPAAHGATQHPATPPHAATASAADLELLEFLGSDDVEPEFQDFLANREPARAPASGRSDKK